MKILHLTLKKKWFDLIASGEKKYEYREIKPYWIARFFKDEEFLIQYDEINFRNGYSKNCPFMRVEWDGLYIAEFEGNKCYQICLGNILEIKNWKQPVKEEE